MALTLPDDVHRSLFALSHEVGQPAASIVSGLLQEMVPQLDALAKIAKATKAGNKNAAKKALQGMVGDSMAEVMLAHQAELDLARKGRR